MPLPAKHLRENTYEMLHNDEFDPNDRSTLLEFLPGDVVRCAPIEGQLTAIELVSSERLDREYWATLYRLVAHGMGEGVSTHVRERIELEVRQALCWHYPQVVQWVKNSEAPPSEPSR
jgi:hypothetical protein